MDYKEIRRLENLGWESERKSYREENKDAIEAKNRKALIRIHAQINAKQARRRAASHNAVPKWVKYNHLLPFYIEALELTEKTGISYDVDHIHPLSHPLVCGLHVPANLQVIPSLENKQKSNKFELP